MRFFEAVISLALSFFELIATIMLAPLTLSMAAGLLIVTAVMRRKLKARGVPLWTGQIKLGA